jgi:hypothetical protein
VASDAGDAWRLPRQTIGDVEDRAIAQVRLAIIDDQTLSAKFGNAMSSAVAVVTLLLPFVGNRDGLEDGWATVLQRRQVFLFQVLGKLIQALGAAFQDHLVVIG